MITSHETSSSILFSLLTLDFISLKLFFFNFTIIVSMLFGVSKLPVFVYAISRCLCHQSITLICMVWSYGTAITYSSLIFQVVYSAFTWSVWTSRKRLWRTTRLSTWAFSFHILYCSSQFIYFLVVTQSLHTYIYAGDTQLFIFFWPALEL